MLPRVTPDVHLYLLIALVAIAVAVVLRVRLLRSILNFVVTVGLIGLLIVVVVQRGRFDPYFSRLA